MRDLLRLVMVAVLSFVIVGAAVAYTRDSDPWQRIAGLFKAEPQPIASVAPDVSDGLRLWVPLPVGSRWVGLAGFPDATEIRIPLPSGLTYTAGTLKLALDAQLGDDGDGRMTLGVNGERRGELVLDSGRARHDVEIALRPTDLVGGMVLLTLEGRGTTSGGQICPVDATNSGAAIALLPESGMSLATDDNIDTLDVRVATLEEPLLLALGSTPTEQANSIWAHQMMVRQGTRVHFAPSGADARLVADAAGNAQALSLDESNRIHLAGKAGVDALLARRLHNPLHAGAIGWPVTVDKLGVETLVRNFRGSRRWTVPFKLADLEGGAAPGRFDFSLKTSLLAPGNVWVVRVSLNGNLLKSGRFNGSSDLIEMSVELPGDIELLENALVIELIDTSPNDSICRVGPDAQAQLLPSSALVTSDAPSPAGWAEMVRSLAASQKLGIFVDGPLDVAQAGVASATLQRFLPLDAEMVVVPDSQGAGTSIQISTAASLRNWQAGFVRAVLSRSESTFIVLPGEKGEPALMPAGNEATTAAIAALADDAVVLVINR